MKFKKSVATDVLVALGSKTAGNWSEKRIVGKITKFADLDDESTAKLDKGQKKFVNKIVKALKKDDTLEMEDDAVADGKAATDGKAPKKDKKPKEPKEKKRGVVAIILECIEASSEKKPTTFTAIIEKLQKELPDRDVKGMSGTAKAVHSWAPPEHGVVVAYGLGDDKDKVWKHGECERGSKAINVSPMAALKQERKEKQKADKKKKKDAKSVPEKAKKDKKEKKKKDKKEKK